MLLYLFNYDGPRIIEKSHFDKVFQVWSSFSVSDIDYDGELDVEEIRMMWWLIEGRCPDKAKLEREISHIDTDGSGTIDRIEWLSYICAPPEPGQTSLGNKNYYDFDMRTHFENSDESGDGLI